MEHFSRPRHPHHVNIFGGLGLRRGSSYDLLMSIGDLRNSDITSDTLISVCVYPRIRSRDEQPEIGVRDYFGIGSADWRAVEEKAALSTIKEKNSR